jgi:predicted Zn-ribbon and HTH transcriptional regulator
MASKRRLRRKECTSKQRFPSQETAKYVLSKIKKQKRRQGKDFSVSPYHCRFCNQWHFGHAIGFSKRQNSFLTTR